MKEHCVLLLIPAFVLLFIAGRLRRWSLLSIRGCAYCDASAIRIGGKLKLKRPVRIIRCCCCCYVCVVAALAAVVGAAGVAIVVIIFAAAYGVLRFSSSIIAYFDGGSHCSIDGTQW